MRGILIGIAIFLVLLLDVVKASPMSEELVCLDGRIIVFCESACNKYVFGKLTTGFDIYAYKYKTLK